MKAREFFESLETQADGSKVRGIDHSYLFDVAGEGQWLVVVCDEKVRVTEGPAEARRHDQPLRRDVRGARRRAARARRSRTCAAS